LRNRRNNRRHLRVNHQLVRQANRSRALQVNLGLPLRARRVNRRQQECLRDSLANREWLRLALPVLLDRALPQP